MISKKNNKNNKKISEPLLIYSVLGTQIILKRTLNGTQ